MKNKKSNKRITDLDEEYIRIHCENKTDEELGKILSCSKSTIKRIRTKLGLNKYNTKSKKEKNAKAIVKENIDADNRRFDNDMAVAAFHRDSLINSERGKKIRELTTSREWGVFVDEWVAYHLQLEDLRHTEKNTIEQIILLSLRISRNQKEYKEYSEVKEELLKNSGITSIAKLDHDDPDNINIYEQFMSASVRASDLNKEYKDMMEQSKKLNETLNVTRQQREKRGKVGGETFFSKCKEFEQRSMRAKEGRRAALLKMATEKSADKMRESVEYMDGEFAPQLLDSRTVELMDKNKVFNKTEDLDEKLDEKKEDVLSNEEN